MRSGQSRLRLVAIILLISTVTVAVLATWWKDTMNGLSEKGFPDDGPRATMEWSKAKGDFVRECTITPPHIEWHGQSVDFDSAWIEQRVKTRPDYVWWHTVEKVPGYYLVIRCKPASRPMLESGSNFLLRSGGLGGFASHGTGSYDDQLTESEYAKGSATVNLVADFHSPTPDPITIRWSP